MKNKNISMLDAEQMGRQEHDGQHDAKRVIIVGGDGSQIAESIKQSLKDLKIEVSQDKVIEAIHAIKMPEFSKEYGSPALTPSPTPEIRIERIEIPTIIKEIEYRTLEVEKPVYITETKTIEIPVVVPEVRIIEVEKQVVVVEPKIIDSSSNLIKALIIIQTIAIILSLFLHK